MVHLIEKYALVAEIEGLKSAAETMLTGKKDLSYWEAQRRLCKKLLSFIDTLEVKEVREEPVSEDLEEAALDYAEACKYDGGEKLLCVEHFKAGAKWQKEKDSILPKVWNRENLDEFSYQTAYDLSNDWIKETPTWHDVEMACKLGAKWKEEQLEKEKERNNYGTN